MYKIRTENSV